MLRPDRNSFTTLDFLGWKAGDNLVIAPKFQRRGVWNSAKRSYLIDTIVKGFPIPPIYIRLGQNEDRTKTIREIIDGQQRVSTILDFLDGKFALSKTLEGSHAGKRFSSLSESQQDSIRNYSLNCETFAGISDREVLEIFARMNTYSVQLNPQELRNGKYFGKFKQAVYELALEHNTFWISQRVFSNSGIARMREAELVSELLIAQLDGMQDKKKSIDGFYSRFDEIFPDSNKSCDRFRRVIDEIQKVFSDGLQDLQWRRPPLFYTLYCFVYHCMFGLPKAEGSPNISRARLSADDRTKLFDAAIELSESLEQSKELGRSQSSHGPFITASQTQTDNITPRKTRFKALQELASFN